MSYNGKKVFVSHIMKVDEQQELFHHIALERDEKNGYIRFIINST
ncbi:hypothetical protein BCH308197_2477 [Bacillus cereus H3081.97]|uniref:Uncharacterized protein n=2 Tax=Bacillus cereus TaxID=1396 RepID=B9J0X1_BACCQ|nr:hypothetical protein BCAH187_A2553 [Bacillus cereus AH187]ACM12803.1 hypothetical protein BCQ_2375 [Bacillus cereus Q1]EDZ59554.1 hypothetical protein BCH308197_2477 [Bacillus cereus H3081.97]KZD52827.1 hypothetical protein B4085_2545 [Bacillus cereus]KZD61333.1 hypothetical protein B4116_2789 [Bacillus cereus]